MEKQQSESPTSRIEHTLVSVEGLLKDVRLQQQQIKRTLLWMTVGNYLRLLFIVIPLVVGILFLPKLLSQVFTQMPGGQTQVFTEIMKAYLPENP